MKSSQATLDHFLVIIRPMQDVSFLFKKWYESIKSEHERTVESLEAFLLKAGKRGVSIWPQNLVAQKLRQEPHEKDIIYRLSGRGKDAYLIGSRITNFSQL